MEYRPILHFAVEEFIGFLLYFISNSLHFSISHLFVRCNITCINREATAQKAKVVQMLKEELR
jgi:hypothetical protein